MYAAVLFLGLQNATSVQPVVAVERTVFYREKAAGLYSAMPYAYAQVTTNNNQCDNVYIITPSKIAPRVPHYSAVGVVRPEPSYRWVRTLWKSD